MKPRHEITERCFKAHSYRKRMKKANQKLYDSEKAKGQAYWERNQLVALLSKFFPAWLERHPEEDKQWQDEWRWIIFIETSEGQATWHIHDSDLENFEHLERREGHSWDGHTTEQKYERLKNIKK